MSDDLRTQIYLNFNGPETEALLEIWRANDRDQWSEMTFDVIRQILQERQVELPPQGEPVQKAAGVNIHLPTNSSHKKSAPKGQPVQLPAQERMLRPEARQVADLSRPQTVVYAVYLAYGALVVQVLLLILNLFTGQSSAPATSPQYAVVIALLLTGYVALQALLIRGAWLGRNVPRILYVGLVLVSLLSVLMSGTWAASFAVQPFRTGLSILTMCGDLVAAALLVVPDSNAWFRSTQLMMAARQAPPDKKQKSQKSTSEPWLARLWPRRWVSRYTLGTLVISFTVSLLASWLVYNLVLLLQEPDYPFDPFPNAMYAMSCLPLHVVILLVGAAIGAISTRVAEERWQQATYAMWTLGLLAILAAIFAAFILPRSGS